jgi:hypothetical protein
MINEVIKILEAHKNGKLQTAFAMGSMFALFGISNRFLIMKNERGKEVFTGHDFKTKTEAENNHYIVEEEF